MKTSNSNEMKTWKQKYAFSTIILKYVLFVVFSPKEDDQENDNPDE